MPQFYPSGLKDLFRLITEKRIASIEKALNPPSGIRSLLIYPRQTNINWLSNKSDLLKSAYDQSYSQTAALLKVITK